METDVLVIGGGPAGAAAAITLAKTGRQCLLVENDSAPPWKIGETLAPESRQILQALGVWNDFQKGGHLESPGICSAWGGEEFVAKDFIFNPHGPAWQLDRPKFEAMLLDAARTAGADVRCGQACRKVDRAGEKWTALIGDQSVYASFLIDASGRGSTLARELGISRQVLDKLVAVYALVPPGTSEQDRDARTYIEARPDGWWYSALLPTGRRVFAWQTDADLLPGQDWRAETWLRDRVEETRHIKSLFPATHRHFDTEPRLTSAHSGRLTALAGDGWLAVGDAAQSFDPLSGEGLFQALFTGHLGAQALLKDGTKNTSKEYIESLNSLWNRFLRNRSAVYAAENRWSDESFWQRRKSQGENS